MADSDALSQVADCSCRSTLTSLDRRSRVWGAALLLGAKGRSPALYAGAAPSRRIPRTLSIVAPSAGDSVTHQVAPAAP
jgi:hypothetical protein